MFNHNNFSSSGRRLFNPEFIHELADQEDSSSGNIQDIFLGQRVGNVAGIKSLPFVSYANFQPVVKDQKFDVNLFAGVFLVAVMNGVDDRFVHSHFDVELGLGARQEGNRCDAY